MLVVSYASCIYAPPAATWLINPTMAPPLSESIPTDPHLQWMLIVLAAATILYITVIRPAFKKKDPLARTPAMSSLSQQRNVDRQMQNLLVELSEMARQISGQLDTRSEKLHMLIEDADQRIAKLQQLEQRTSSAAPTAYVPPPLAEPPRWAANSEIARVAPKSEPADTQHQPVYSLADQGRSATEIAHELSRPRGEVELILALRPR